MREFYRAVQQIETIGRVIEGTALTYNRAYRVSDDGGRSFYLEGWRAGAFGAELAAMGNTFELRVNHADMRAGMVVFTETSRALEFTATADDTDLGRTVLGLIDAGATGRVSLRFSSTRQKERDGVVWRLQGRPRELSVTMGAQAQYDDALVTGRRMLEADHAMVEAAAARAARSAELLARSRAVVARGSALV